MSAMPSFSLDKPNPVDNIHQFASQHEGIPKEIRAWCEEKWDGEQSEEFYHGLITAYANVVAMFDCMEPEEVKTFIGQVLSFVCNKSITNRR